MENENKSENKVERKGNNKLATLIGGLIIIAVSIFIIVMVSNQKPSCEEGKEFKDGQCVAIREVDTYTFKHDYPDKKNKHFELTVEVPKALGYVAKENDTKIELYRESDRSTISIYAMMASKNSIAMAEKDYSKSAWKDYKVTENDDGSKIVEVNKIRSDGSIFGVEWSKAFSKVVENYWSGVRVSVMASGLDQGKDSSFDGKQYKTFAARDTYESEDYQYMLNSIKVEVTDIPTTK